MHDQIRPRPARPTARYHRAMKTTRIGLVAAFLFVAGCSAAGSSVSPSASPAPSLSMASEQPSIIPGPSSSPSAGTIDLPAPIIAAVKAEIAKDAGVSASDVTIISGEAVSYPDGSLGCPQPGMAYTQIPVDGWKVVGTAAGATFDYRGSGLTEIRRCEKPS